ncbi:hypothetical protein CEE37_08565 [candidate division LCP-89 bacterium B3_LCP]|uniref:DinB-like domain-containing protein n=1 Tax=candidate division LCP-89 bacterium B3_LCP TaxID=2012998 RepID=A0A532UZJ2_UNCL8|nr:MAG: hypothetical protein CEE37_08565 [candidate division LCP-89 bacterium B3_LCP]
MTFNLGKVIWNQFGAAIDTLGEAIKACPEDLWRDRSQKPEYWYTAYHTLFWLDFYLSDTPDGFTPPKPFDMSEMDPAGLLPDRVYSKQELLTYLEHGRQKCLTKIEGLTEEKAEQRYQFGWMDFTITELLLYNMRHVQHHAAQLNLILRQQIDSAPRWVRQAKR